MGGGGWKLQKQNQNPKPQDVWPQTGFVDGWNVIREEVAGVRDEEAKELSLGGTLNHEGNEINELIGKTESQRKCV